jgi:GT2 family glycosyltransferase
LFEEIGRFDASLRCYEEADLCWRLQLAGGDPPQFVSAAVLHHRLERRGTERVSKAAMYGRTQVLLYSRYRHAGMPRQAFGEAVAAWRRLMPDLIRRMFRRTGHGVGWEAAIRFGRLQGSLRHWIAYF